VLVSDFIYLTSRFVNLI